MLATVSAFCMPTMYCTEPEMPTFSMNLGLTVVPLWPICKLWSSQPSSTSGREQASSPPRSAASVRSCSISSGFFMPLPPATSTSASFIDTPVQTFSVDSSTS